MNDSPLHTGTGMVLGKFMPPHAGHQYLIDFARQYVAHLTVLVCSIKREPIPGLLRYQWLREMFPQCRVVHIADEIPQEPAEHPDFWNIWLHTIRREIPTGPDFVFASEDYGWKLAKTLGARFIPVDIHRQSVSISSSQIRSDPMTHWAHIPPVVRPHYVRRICVFGPESTGKTTLANDLAKHYQTVAVQEHARLLLDHQDGRCYESDIPLIARGQIAAEDALAAQANRVIFCDTDLLLTTTWSDILFGGCPQWIRDAAVARPYDLYLLLDVDVPWVDDSQRYLPHKRKEFFERCRRLLDDHHRRYVVIRGDWAARFAVAREAVNELLAERQ